MDEVINKSDYIYNDIFVSCKISQISTNSILMIYIYIYACAFYTFVTYKVAIKIFFKLI